MIGTNRYIGSPVERIEDLRFLRGRGRFVGVDAREHVGCGYPAQPRCAWPGRRRRRKRRACDSRGARCHQRERHRNRAAHPAASFTLARHGALFAASDRGRPRVLCRRAGRRRADRVFPAPGSDASLQLAETAPNKMRAFYHCTMCIVVVDAQKIDHPGQPILCLEGTECRHWTRSLRRSSGSARRSHASMRSATSSPASSANWKRPNVCSRATPRAPGRKRRPQRRRRRQQRKQPLQPGHAAAGVLLPENRRAQAQLVDPGGSGPRPGNRQDAAGNRRRMQGSSPEPCRRRHRSAQAGQPHRRARWEALRHTVSGDDATWRGLTPEDKKAPAELNRKRLAGLSEHGAALIGLRICNDPRRAP